MSQLVHRFANYLIFYVQPDLKSGWTSAQRLKRALDHQLSFLFAKIMRVSFFNFNNSKWSHELRSHSNRKAFTGLALAVFTA